MFFDELQAVIGNHKLSVLYIHPNDFGGPYYLIEHVREQLASYGTPDAKLWYPADNYGKR